MADPYGLGPLLVLMTSVLVPQLSRMQVLAGPCLFLGKCAIVNLVFGETHKTSFSHEQLDATPQLGMLTLLDAGTCSPDVRLPGYKDFNLYGNGTSYSFGFDHDKSS